MAQTIRLQWPPEELKLRTATRFRYVVVTFPPADAAPKLTKAKSSDSLATATRELDRVVRRAYMGRVGFVVDLSTQQLVAQESNLRTPPGPLKVHVTGSRGR